jgi:hypothetical protein
MAFRVASIRERPKLVGCRSRPSDNLREIDRANIFLVRKYLYAHYLCAFGVFMHAETVADRVESQASCSPVNDG